MLLLSIAIGSTWIAICFGIITNIFGLPGWVLIWATNIDSVINIIALYLQYPFNRKYYDRYCKCIYSICVEVAQEKFEKNVTARSSYEVLEAGRDETNLGQDNDHRQLQEGMAIVKMESSEDEAVAINAMETGYELEHVSPNSTRL